jgi:ParB family chromosome partitioning protein
MAAAKSSHRRALGRGLTALIPQDTEDKGSGDEIVYIDINAVRENPFQPRRDFDDVELRQLADSIKSQGLLQPILLRKKGAGYEIISGERRFRALRLLGNDKIPGIVKPQVADRDMIELSLVENIQRENLNPIEEAEAFQRLLLECGLSHEKLSERVGKSRSAVTNALRLLKLSADVLEMVRNGGLSAGHARALLSIDGIENQREMARRIAAGQWSVRQIEELTKAAGPPAKNAGDKAPKRPLPRMDPDLSNQMEQLQYRFGTPVTVTQTAGGSGKIHIAFFTKDDLDRILRLLGGSR